MLTKIMAGAMAILIAICALLWFDGQSAKDRATTAEAALTTQNEELMKAENDKQELNNVIKRQNEMLAKAQKEYTRIKRVAAQREFRIKSLTDSAGDVASFNVELRDILERAQGFRFTDGVPGEASASSPGDGANGLRSGMTYREFAEASLINLGRCADTLQAIYSPPD